MKRKKASAVGFRPARMHTRVNLQWVTNKALVVKGEESAATDHEVGDTAEHQARERPQREDVRQDLAQEVDRDPVVATDVLVTDSKHKEKMSPDCPTINRLLKAEKI